jgi:hypothetical protein
MSMALFSSLCHGQIIKSPIDSIRIYYVELSFKNSEVITPDILKQMPITRTALIVDANKLASIKEQINRLTIDSVKPRYFQTYVLCELYLKKRKKQLQMNEEEHYLMKSHYYGHNERLFALIYPKGATN